MSKKYKNGSRNSGRHVQLGEWLQKSEAWATLKPGPRALYLEIKRRFNGKNNGKIIFSHRDAAKAINVNRNTIGNYFEELIERGFVVITVPHHLGPSGIGLASVWGLTEEPMHGMPATKDFMKWCPKNKIPAQNSGQGVTKNRTPKQSDCSAPKLPVLKKRTQNADFEKSTS